MEDENKNAQASLPDMNPEAVVYGPPPEDVANLTDVVATTKGSVCSACSESDEFEKTLIESDEEKTEGIETENDLLLGGVIDINEGIISTDNDNLFQDEIVDSEKDNNPKDSFESNDKSEETSDYLIKEEDLKQINGKIDGITGFEQKIFSEIREIHKLYHTEFAGRLLKMQDELDEYHKIDRGKVFDGILESLARIYCNSETLPDEVEDPKAKKNIKYMLMDIEDLCSEYGMTRYRSALGDKRSPKNCQIVERVPTNDHEKHDTVAKTYNSGFLIGNRVVMKERVDVYFYDEITESKETEQDNNLINE